ncbi:hypothetical protein [Methanobacterium ferruginis]|uniref:hypothetical protein n=1 Tax=Methanobacterium ferruginis TaxID=710191 RepID=UPI002572791E|nr:hypothetical protein [Methanobacterium ferruginis]BDZ67244.1 hypothetical protein GCM10025860_06920 [Methanobacterium ferruginis]
MKLDGEEIILNQGQFWFDHQWGNALEPLGNSRCKVVRAASTLSKPSHSRGWDWFMAQFDGDREMTMYAPHTDKNMAYYWQTGEESPGTMTVAVKGQYIDAEHEVVDIKGTLNIDKWVQSVKSSNPENYFITNTWYPDQWEFQFQEMVPEDIRHFTMTPIVSGGQTGYNASGSQYSEGELKLEIQRENSWVKVLLSQFTMLMPMPTCFIWQGYQTHQRCGNSWNHQKHRPC